VQLGQDRGGFYSYDWLENLAAADIHNVDRVAPEMQHLKGGDFVPMAPVEWGIPTGGFTVADVEPERAIVWLQGRPQDLDAPGEGGETWAFVLACVLTRMAMDRGRLWTSATDRGTMDRHGLLGPTPRSSALLPGLALPVL
jgi:hypothetical protein